MIDPNNNLTDLLGSLPNLADLAELYWKTASHDIAHLVHQASSDVIQALQGDHSPLGNELSKLDVPLRFSWRRD
jgi:hypothetical protein